MLIDHPGGFDLGMGVVGEQGVQAGVLPGGEEAGAGVQGAAGGVQRVAGTAAVAVERLLDTAADVVEGFGGGRTT